MHACGYTTGLFHDPSRSDWTGDSARPIRWSAWYPCKATGPGARPVTSIFDTAPVHMGAPLAEPGPFPVVLLSHGTGGTADSLSWLAHALAERGFVVLGANHHGNTGAEPYRAEGFLCWWERAPDMSLLLTGAQQYGLFAGKLDEARVAAIGYSLGCHTVLSLAGAHSDMGGFDRWRAAEAPDLQGPIEFPDLADHLPRLRAESAAFSASWARHGEDYRDDRVSAVILIAPPSPVRAFAQDDIEALDLPVTLLTGGADVEAPFAHGAAWLLDHNPCFQHVDLGAHVGHFTFLSSPAPDAPRNDLLFSDHPTVDRREIHALALQHIAQALSSV